MNIVDTSTETINAEFEAAEREIGTETPEQREQQETELAQAAMDEAQREAEIGMATGIIASSLKFAIGSFSGVTIDDALCGESAKSYAVLIIKYFPGGIFALLDQYKEEIGAATATFLLIRAVSTAKEEQRDAEERAKQDAKDKEQEKQASHDPQITQGSAV